MANKPMDRNLRLTEVIRFIDSHFSQDLKLADMAAMANMAVSTFSHKFKETYGVAFRNYVVALRLQQIERELLESDDDVCQICYRWGFNTQTNFNRLFKQRHGCTPTEYRENKKRK